MGGAFGFSCPRCHPNRERLRRTSVARHGNARPIPVGGERREGTSNPMVISTGGPTSDSVFFGYNAKSELFASKRRFWPFIRRAIYLEANLNVKREMSEFFDKPG
jgi:hypothetical protein